MHFSPTPLIYAGFEKSNLKIISVLSTNRGTFKIFGRKDKKIFSQSDLKGKTINTPPGTAMVYFLEILLNKNGINKKDVKITNYSLSKAIEILLAGEIDAITTFDTMTSEILEKLLDNGIVFLRKVSTQHLSP